MKRRRLLYRRRRRSDEGIGDDGQDSFLDVVSNLVGILIILVMIAGSRVRDASSAPTPETALNDSAASASDESSPEETAARSEYVAAVEELDRLRADVEKKRAETEELSAQTLLVEQQANGVEAEYKSLIESTAALEGALDAASRQRSAADQIAFDLKSELFEKEKTLDELRREMDAFAAARPAATVLENVPTSISQKVENREGFFCLKNGRISRVPMNVFMERVRLSFKNYRGDLTKKEIEETIGPVEGYTFRYLVNCNSSRDSDGVRYSLIFRYGECVPENDALGEPLDDALANPNSAFQNALKKHDRYDTTITTFVYPDSFEYLRDLKKFLVSNGWQIAIRPLPAGAPIAVSPEGTASTTY